MKNTAISIQSELTSLENLTTDIGNQADLKDLLRRINALQRAVFEELNRRRLTETGGQART